MNISIKYIREPGSREHERVVLEVTERDDVGRYILARSSLTSDRSISSDLQDVYWLPDQKVEAGDLVVIYTKSGRNKSKQNRDGSSSHFLYWGLPDPMWNERNAVPVLFCIEDWQHRRRISGA
jgi:hypothetical protein